MAAHVTFFRLKALPGKRLAVIEQFAKWEREQEPKANGFERSILVANNNDPDEFMVAVRFETNRHYQANSDRQEQGSWYGELRANLVDDPMWFDGNLVRETMA
jgi:heme-degrading monooxygenase HmoA